MPEFDTTVRRWDKFKEFHVGYGPNLSWSADISGCAFIHFQKGDLILQRCSWEKPDLRRAYLDGSVRITSTADATCPKLAIPGDDKPLPTAWLTRGGQQILLVDHDHNIAVAVAHGGKKLRNENAFVWYEYGEAKPVSSASIKVSRFEKYTKEQRAHIDGLVNGCRAWAEMIGSEELKKQRVAPEKSRYTRTQKAVPTDTLLQIPSFEKLSFVLRFRVLTFGIETSLTEERYPYLNVIANEGGSPKA
jgi:hypothetical protein